MKNQTYLSWSANEFLTIGVHSHIYARQWVISEISFMLGVRWPYFPVWLELAGFRVCVPVSCLLVPESQIGCMQQEKSGLGHGVGVVHKWRHTLTGRGCQQICEKLWHGGGGVNGFVMSHESFWYASYTQHGRPQKFFQRGPTSKFCLPISSCWWYNANGRSQNALPFLRHEENTPCDGNKHKNTLRWQQLPGILR